MSADSGNQGRSGLSEDHPPGGQVSPDKGSSPETEAAPFSSSRPFRVGWYVDGFNLYHAVQALNDPRLKWLDVRSLAASYIRPGQSLERIVFSTAYNTWDAGKRQRHIAYVRALELIGVEVLKANFDKVPKFCRRESRYCDFHEEKQSDVNLAVEALCDVYERRVDTVFFLTADSDQIPTFKAIRQRFPSVRVYLVAPPGRLSHARDLGQHAHSVFELTAGRIRAHPLPPSLKDSRGRTIVTRPSAYGAHD